MFSIGTQKFDSQRNGTGSLIQSSHESLACLQSWTFTLTSV